LILVASVFLGSFAHLVTGGNFYRLLFNIVVAFVGFVAGQAVSEIASIRLFSIGSLNLLTGILGPLCTLALSSLLWREPVDIVGQNSEPR
jgi:hypothetical protein